MKEYYKEEVKNIMSKLKQFQNCFSFAVVADTHLIRITNLLGLVDTKDPAKVEKELKALLDPKKSNDFCHRCVLHGRAVCIARRPNCPACVMNGFCSYYLKQK